MTQTHRQFSFAIFDEDFEGGIIWESYTGEIAGAENLTCDSHAYKNSKFQQVLSLVKEHGKIVSAEIMIPMSFKPPFMQYDEKGFVEAVTKQGFHCVEPHALEMSVFQVSNEDSVHVRFYVEVPEEAIPLIAAACS